MAVNVAINGFGRIGRNVFRTSLNDDNINITNINDITDPATLAHLLKYDSVFGPIGATVEATDGAIIVNGKKVKITAEREPANLPWGEDGVDIALECTGLFTQRDKAEGHLKAGAKKVIISAPAKEEDITICMGVNNEKYEPAAHNIISNASCTTNCLSPVAKVLNDSFGIVRGLMTTVHAYTNYQKILDLPLVCEFEKEVTAEEVNAAIKAAAEGKMKGILQYLDEPCVSVDFKQNPHSSIFDSALTKVIGGNMVKILSWYDNEWGFSCRMKDLVNYIDSKGL
jgi:glyceraldehyde 3-phosphate dehydrogenase